MNEICLGNKSSYLLQVLDSTLEISCLHCSNLQAYRLPGKLACQPGWLAGWLTNRYFRWFAHTLKLIPQQQECI